jgi:hypothetical protein
MNPYLMLWKNEKRDPVYCFDPRHFTESRFGLKNRKIQS